MKEKKENKAWVTIPLDDFKILKIKFYLKLGLLLAFLYLLSNYLKGLYA